MIKKSRQKFKYFENKKSFWGGIKSIFHHFWIVAKNSLRPNSAFLRLLLLSLCEIVSSYISADVNNYSDVTSSFSDLSDIDTLLLIKVIFWLKVNINFILVSRFKTNFVYKASSRASDFDQYLKAGTRKWALKVTTDW